MPRTPAQQMDAFGHVLTIGQLVTYLTTQSINGGARELTLGRVIGFTPTTIRVRSVFDDSELTRKPAIVVSAPDHIRIHENKSDMDIRALYDDPAQRRR